MKKIIVLSTALFLSFTSFAQNDSTMNKKRDNTTDSKTIEMSKTDGVMMRNNTMMVVKKGKITPMTTDLVCYDGTVVRSNGSATKKEGYQMMLKEGEYMDISGKIIPINDYRTPSDKNNSNPKKDKNMYLLPDTTL